MAEFDTIAAAAAALEAGRISAVELVQDRLDLCQRVEPKLHSFITLDTQGALKAAAEADAARAGGRATPLTGIPVGVKDVIDVAGLPATGHSRLYAERTAQKDAFAVARLRAAGAVFMGKLATNEFAIGLHDPDTALAPQPRNPWNLAHSTGGSSSGAGTSVAAGEVLGALGTDTGGSIRVPAAFNGIAGLKPSRGLVSRTGTMPLSETMDSLGPMARTVQDLALLLDGIVGADPAETAQMVTPEGSFNVASRDCPTGLRYLRLRRYDHLLPEGQIAALDTAEAALVASGAQAVEVDLPDLDAIDAVGTLMATCESWHYHRERLAQQPEKYGRDARLKLMIGALISGDDYLLASRLRQRFITEFSALFAKVDVILTHPVLGAAPRAPERPKVSFATWAHAGFNMQINVIGVPGLVLRTGMDGDLPVGAQLWGGHGRDALLLAVGRSMERYLADKGDLPDWPQFGD
ncbi:amidase [Sulfitobacter sp. 20_GPM-1509m]|uniref:amidase n=1 Tax=Sulfitobacter sp. 20_GPM-1509m TaxID=1380367 RepID=UPI0006858456|nr:amidase [Sulfitobacter sp. 20_GPM-1509m]